MVLLPKDRNWVDTDVSFTFGAPSRPMEIYISRSLPELPYTAILALSPAKRSEIDESSGSEVVQILTLDPDELIAVCRLYDTLALSERMDPRLERFHNFLRLLVEALLNTADETTSRPSR